VSGLRIDKALWFLRLAKSRSLAQKMIAAGEVRIEGTRPANAHATIQPGQTLTLTANARFRVVRVDALPLRRGPAPEAQACYTELVPSRPIDAIAATL
jgi:ribosomal 50S subunit-recycling heat shock protein